MRPTRSEELLIRAARMYYLQEQSQVAIASSLGTSRSNVSRMLKSARDQGLVKMSVTEISPRDRELESLLVTRFGLSDARVLALESDLSRHQFGVGRLAAEWLVDEMRDNQRIALSWGTTIQALVAALETHRRYDVEVSQLVGGLSGSASEVTGEELVRQLAGKIGGTFRYLHAPAVFSSPQTLRGVLLEPSIVEALEVARRCDIAVVGIGAVGYGSSATIIESMNLTPSELARFDAASPVGDICGRYFDLEGRQITDEVHDRILAVELEDLARIPLVLGAVSGVEKARGLLGALAGHHLDVVICDQLLAQQVLRLAGNEYTFSSKDDASKDEREQS